MEPNEKLDVLDVAKMIAEETAKSAVRARFVAGPGEERAGLADHPDVRIAQRAGEDAAFAYDFALHTAFHTLDALVNAPDIDEEEEGSD